LERKHSCTGASKPCRSQPDGQGEHGKREMKKQIKEGTSCVSRLSFG
jgi:hypothetical protein